MMLSIKNLKFVNRLIPRLFIKFKHEQCCTEYFQFYRSWMYDRIFPGIRKLKPCFKDEVSFLTY